ncbi:MAG: aminoacyl-tRNA deacylase, partial [Promethearchaeota archaeon]
MNLKAYLIRAGIDFEFFEKKETHTADAAAKSLGVPLNKIVKSIVFLDENKLPLLAIVRGDQHVSRKKLQQVFNLKKVKTASTEIAERTTGYPTGGIPPIGHRKPLRTVIDPFVLENDFIWAGGGTRKKMVKLKTSDILRLSKALVKEIT